MRSSREKFTETVKMFTSDNLVTWDLWISIFKLLRENLQSPASESFSEDGRYCPECHCYLEKSY